MADPREIQRQAEARRARSERLSKLASVEVIDVATGEPRTLTGPEAVAASERGEVVLESTEAQQRRRRVESAEQHPIKAGLSALARGTTLGLSDVVLRGLGVSPETLAGYQEAFPTLSLGGEIVGGVGSALAGPAALIGKGAARIGASVAGRIAGSAASAGTVAKVAGAVTAAAVESAGQGLGYAASTEALSPDGVSADRFLKNLRNMTLIGTGLTSAIGGASAVARRTLGKVVSPEEALAGARALEQTKAAVREAKQGATVSTDQMVSVQLAAADPRVVGSKLGEKLQAAIDSGEAGKIGSALRQYKSSQVGWLDSGASKGVRVGDLSAKDSSRVLNRLRAAGTDERLPQELRDEITSAMADPAQMAKIGESLDARASQALGASSLRADAEKRAAEKSALNLPSDKAQLTSLEKTQYRELSELVGPGPAGSAPEFRAALEARMAQAEAKRLGAGAVALDAMGDSAKAGTMAELAGAARGLATHAALNTVGGLASRAIAFGVGTALGGAGAGALSSMIVPGLVSKVKGAIAGTAGKEVLKEGAKEAAERIVRSHAADAALRETISGPLLSRGIGAGGSVVASEAVAKIAPIIDHLISPATAQLSRLGVQDLRAVTETSPQELTAALATAAPLGTPPAVVDAAVQQAQVTQQLIRDQIQSGRGDRDGGDARLKKLTSYISDPRLAIERHLQTGGADKISAAVLSKLYPQLIETTRRLARAEAAYADATSQPSRKRQQRLFRVTADPQDAPLLYQTQTVRQLQGMHAQADQQGGRTLSRTPDLSTPSRGRSSRIAGL